MGSNFSGRTSLSLLHRLQRDADDQTAWSEFVHRYGRLIYQWCRRWNLQETDAQDVTQTVLVKLVEKMRSFEYDPTRSFRAYLKTLTHYAWCDFLEHHKRPGAGSGGSQVLELLEGVEARDELATRLQEEFDKELLEEATARVRARVEPHTWEAFRLTALDGCSGAAAAQQLGMEVTAVFKAKSRVQKMLQAEVQQLEGP
jgi:RNA polymerase sigma-70 factor (ECF subfamily)